MSKHTFVALLAAILVALVWFLLASLRPSTVSIGHARAQTIIAEFPGRIPNLRHLDNSIERYEFLFGLLNLNLNSETTIFIGSSNLWGYPMREELTLPYYYSEITNEHVQNLSLIGSRLAWSVAFSCYLNHHNATIRRLFVSIPFTNDVGRLAWAFDSNQDSQIDWNFDCPDGDYEITLDDLMGQISEDEFERLMGRTPNNESRTRFAFGPLPENYFANRERYDLFREQWSESLERFIRQLAEQSDQLTIMVPPVFMPAVERGGYEIDDIQAQIDDVVAACERAAEGRDDITCFTPGEEFILTIENFANITHSNAHGFRALAEMLANTERGTIENLN